MPQDSPAVSLPVNLIFPVEVARDAQRANPVNPEYLWHFLAEGDSWFTIAAIPSSNLLNGLRLPRWAQVLSIATPGDTIRHMSDILRNPDFKKFVSKTGFNYPFHGLLLSAGGNDLIDAAPQLIRLKPARGQDAEEAQSYIEQAALDTLLADVQAGVTRLHKTWNSASSLSAGQPIFMHTYDYVTPRDAPAKLAGSLKLAGPWIYPVFKGCGLSVRLQQRIVDRLFDRLAESLLALDCRNGSSGLSQVHVVDTRHTLVMANPAEVDNSNDWLNEIHPNSDGYAKLAARISARISAEMTCP